MPTKGLGDSSTHLLDCEERTLTIPSAGEDTQPRERSHMPGANAKWCRYSGKRSAVPYKVNHTLNMGPSTSTPRGKKAYAHTTTCTQIFTAALLVTAKPQKSLTPQVLFLRFLIFQVVMSHD